MTHHGEDEPTFVSSPEEMKAAVLQRHDRQRMVQQAWEDELRGFLDAQPVNHLVTLRKILVMCGGDTRHYITGMLTGILQFERRVCSECGEDHSAMPTDMQAPADLSGLVPPVEGPKRIEVYPHQDAGVKAIVEGAPSVTPDEIGPAGRQEALFDEAIFKEAPLPRSAMDLRSDSVYTREDSPPTRQEQLRAALGLTAEDIANMATYWLDDAWSNDGTKFLGYACTGTGPTKGACGVVYSSIADRMLKDPDECHGCNLRGRWG